MLTVNTMKEFILNQLQLRVALYHLKNYKIFNSTPRKSYLNFALESIGHAYALKLNSF